MKKIISLSLALFMLLAFAGCKKEGDLGKQTTVDKDNGYTLVREVKMFEFSGEEDELEKKNNVRRDGFKYTEEKPKAPVKIKTDAINIAREEATVDYNKIGIAFDRTRGIWKVTFFKSVNDSETGKTKDSVLEVIYVDEDGYTIAAYKNV